MSCPLPSLSLILHEHPGVLKLCAPNSRKNWDEYELPHDNVGKECQKELEHHKDDLVVLSFTGFEFSCKRIMKIFDFGWFEKLEVLILSGNAIDGTFGYECPPRLRILDLSHNEIGPKGVESLVSYLEDSSWLRELYLGFNHIGYSGVQHLKKLLPNLPKLNILDLAWNQLTGKGFDELVELLCRGEVCSGLRELNVEKNGIGDYSLAAELMSNFPIRSLNLGHNWISDIGVGEIVDALPNSHVQYLLLGWNQIGKRCAHHIAEMLPLTKYLVELDLARNWIDRQGKLLLISNAHDVHDRRMHVNFNSDRSKGIQKEATAAQRNSSTSVNDAEGEGEGEAEAEAEAEDVSSSDNVSDDGDREGHLLTASYTHSSSGHSAHSAHSSAAGRSGSGEGSGDGRNRRERDLPPPFSPSHHRDHRVSSIHSDDLQSVIAFRRARRTSSPRRPRFSKSLVSNSNIDTEDESIVEEEDRERERESISSQSSQYELHKALQKESRLSLPTLGVGMGLGILDLDSSIDSLDEEIANLESEGESEGEKEKEKGKDRAVYRRRSSILSSVAGVLLGRPRDDAQSKSKSKNSGSKKGQRSRSESSGSLVSRMRGLRDRDRTITPLEPIKEEEEL